MKACPVCKQTYTDEGLNFCLNDGAALTVISNDPPPTVFMNPDRQTAPIRSNYNTNTGWENQPPANNVNFAMTGQPTLNYQGENQTLPTVSLILGILAVILGCCWGGIPLGTGALITGYIALQNVNREPTVYSGRGMAIGGVVTGAIGVILGILMIVSLMLPKG